MSKSCAIYAWPIRLSSFEGAIISASHFDNCDSKKLAIPRGILYCEVIMCKVSRHPAARRGLRERS